MLPANRSGTVYGARKIFSPPIRSSGIASFHAAWPDGAVAHLHGGVPVVVAGDLPLEAQTDQRRRFDGEGARLDRVGRGLWREEAGQRAGQAQEAAVSWRTE